MNEALLRKSERLYSFVLQLYPKRYRQEFGEEMQYVFSESLKDAYGKQAILAYWVRIFIDTSKSLITQHVENQREGGDSMKAKSNSKDIFTHNKVFLWLALGIGLILLIPLVGQWPWTMSDFIVAGTLLLGFGSVFVLAARKFRKNRVIIGFVLFGLLLWLWVELAVGLFTNWGS